jgi:hypothetical protein
MAIPLFACGVGLLFSLFPMWISGLRFVPGDAGDVRFVQLLMEHSYQWLGGHAGGRAFWDFPAFYPVKNTLAYSETLLGVAPFYWFWRLLGAGPDLAYALWLIVMLSLNFWVGRFFLKRGLGLGELAASSGAFLLAFGSPRIAQLNHPQLTPIFYAVLAAYALMKAVTPGRRAEIWPWVAGACCVLQFYAGYYTAIFLVISVVIGAGCALCVPVLRKQILTSLASRRVLTSWISAGLVACVALYPMASHYLAAAHTVGVREYWAVEAWLPRIQSWLYLGSSSWLYGWADFIRAFKVLPMGHEQQAGIGLLTPALVVWGLIGGWKGRPAARVAACILGVLLITSTLLPPGFSLWRIWYAIIPGVSALRSVSRIGIFLLFPAALGLAFWVDARALPKGAWLLFFVFLEQGRGVPAFDIVGARRTIDAIKDELNHRQCEVFFVTVRDGREPAWKYQIDAMWAAVESGVPTINGYSGNFPGDWGNLYDIAVRSPDQQAQLERSAEAWALEHRNAKPCNIAVRDPS